MNLVAVAVLWTVVPIITSDAFTAVTSNTYHHNNNRYYKPLSSSTTNNDIEPTTTTTITTEEDDNSFSKLGLTPQLLTSIQSQGWETPTPIQRMAIPAMLASSSYSDNDDKEATGSSSLWAEAPTGSGKTAAFAIPLLELTMEARRKRRMRKNVDDGAYGGGSSGGGRSNRVVRRNAPSNTDNNNNADDTSKDVGGASITTLILSPTRELALQTGGVIEELIEALPSSSTTPHSASSAGSRDEEMEVLVITGGVPLEPQIQRLVQHVNSGRDLDILVATPGRLVDVLVHYREKFDTVESELERRLLRALDASTSMPDDDDSSDADGGSYYGRRGGNDKTKTKGTRKRKRNKNSDVSLSLATIEELGINEGIRDGDDGGRGQIGEMAHGLKYLVFDEADRLLGDRGFQKEVDELLTLLPQGDGRVNSVKTFLYSATFPEHIQPRVQRVLQRVGGKDAPPPLRLSCSSSFVIDNGSGGAVTSTTVTTDTIEGGDDDDDEDGTISARQRKRNERTTQPSAVVQGPDSTIKLRTIRIEERDRTQALKRLILQHTDDIKQPESYSSSSSWDKILVFVSTRYQTEHIARKLRRLNIAASDLHGKLDMDARTRRLQDFKRGKIRVLIATDLASRGLDVQGLPVVFNYDLPRASADFIHRVGRTGRAGRSGEAVTFVTPTGEAHFNLIEKRHLSTSDGTVVKREVLKGFEPNEERWKVDSALSVTVVEGVEHSMKGLAHDQMFGGVKGRRKSKKDRVREQAALEKMRAGDGGERYGL